LSPISASATMPVDTRNASIGVEPKGGRCPVNQGTSRPMHHAWIDGSSGFSTPAPWTGAKYIIAGPLAYQRGGYCQNLEGIFRRGRSTCHQLHSPVSLARVAPPWLPQRCLSGTVRSRTPVSICCHVPKSFASRWSCSLSPSLCPASRAKRSVGLPGMLGN
jgi:hypothetical protein